MESIPVLMIDDDVELCGLLGESLRTEAISVEAAHEGAQGLERVSAGDYRLVLLDVALPGMSGFEVLRCIRRDTDIPVLMLTGRSEDIDRIVGLEMGADDYVTKPFNTRELAARIRAVLRRSGGGGASPGKLCACGLEIDPRTMTAILDGEPLKLTMVEFELLSLLMRRAGEVVTREEMSEKIMGRPIQPYDRGMDMHVSNLRRKLGKGTSGHDRIRTIRGVGYMLCHLH